MANYQIILGNFHTDKANVWHTFSAQTDKIAQEKMVDELDHVLDRTPGDHATLVKLVSMVYLDQTTED